MKRRAFVTSVMAACLVSLSAPPGFAQSRPAAPPKKEPPLPAALEQQARDAVRRGLEFLKASQDTKGGWTATAYGPAITAIAAQAFAQSPDYGPRHPIVRRAVANVMTYVQPDGGVYQPGANLANYQTSVVAMMLASLNDPAHREPLTRAIAFLRRLQYSEDSKIEPTSAWYGGAGYTQSPPKRPDLSNTQMMVEALHQSGLPPEDPAYQRALKFISRCQMSSETNDQPFARRADDGGFIYSPIEGGESKGGTIVVDGAPQLRSYGSMTYAGFKSMLYANVRRDDPRIQKAVRWIRRNWTLESNPNMPGKQSQEGLYYYYHVFAKALRAWGEPVIVDDKGVPHRWRVELCQRLIKLQNKDGSWLNAKDRWLEGDANYITALTVLSLQEALRAD
jgi:squalene-hopene/tetraprenyl-beta-curcumene cyclase